MLDYIKNYKDRISLGTGSRKDKFKKQIEMNFDRYLNEVPTANYIKLTEPNEINISERTREVLCSVTDITMNDKRVLDEKYIEFSNECNAKEGCYFEFEGHTWILIHQEVKTMGVFKKFTAAKCNQTLNYRYKGVVYNIPVSIGALTMYSDGIADDKYTFKQDAKRSLIMGSSPITRNWCKVENRVMFSDSDVFKIAHVNDFVVPGVIDILVSQCALSELDDTENLIPYNPDYHADPVHVPTNIEGEKRIVLGSSFTYTMCDKNLEVNWEVIPRNNNLNFIKVLDNTPKYITIQASLDSKFTGQKFTIVAKDIQTNEILDEKEVSIKGLSL